MNWHCRTLAGRMAGWPEERELWTCSCPCQPFSIAGKKAGISDTRHLWPDYFRIHRARRPAVVFGEQVARAAGGDWLDGVLADLEGEGYAWWAGIVPACAVNAPHERQRLWWCGVDRWGRDLAYEPGFGRGRIWVSEEGPGSCELPVGRHDRDGGAVGLAYAQHSRFSGRHTEGRRSDPGVPRDDIQCECDLADRAAPGEWRRGLCRSCQGGGAAVERASSEPAGPHDSRGLVRGAGERRGEGRPEPEFRRGRHAAAGATAPSGDVGHGHGQGRAIGQGECGDACPQRTPAERADRGCCRCGEPVGDGQRDGLPGRGHLSAAPNGGERNFWRGARWIDCHDGKRRRVPGTEKRSESGIRLLVDGVSGRMDALRAYGGGGEGGTGWTGGADRRISRSAAWRPLGNAIVPQVAAELIRAFLDCQP